MTPPSRTSDLLTAPHGFFGRAGGVSTGAYDSLNCGEGSDDDPACVTENRRRVCAALGADRLITPFQTHSADVVVVDANTPPRPTADAVITTAPRLAISVVTADCVPVLFQAPGMVGAAHAGWRGAKDGILENTVAAMVSLGAAPADIRAAIGPCLRPPHFHVRADLIDAFSAAGHDVSGFLAPDGPDHHQFDLAAFVHQQLSRAGLTAIDDVGGNTLGAPDRWFSYRHAQTQNIPDAGRNLSAIMPG